MDFVECKDPIFSESPLDAYVHEFPSNTYYPPGVLCAKERDEYLCPTSGESGSPFMSTANKLTTEGILSFVKGCTRFAFGKYQVFLAEELSAQFDINVTDTGANVVIQDSDNPLVYTKLYCYLPWIAQQYGLEYDETISDDSDCLYGSGDSEDGRNKICTNIPTSAKEVIEGIERPCIFPYYVDGRLINDTCFKLNQEDFLDPVSRCPIWQIRTKIDSINSYNSSDSRY